MDSGYILRGVEILQAASLQYPDDLGVRRAVAGAYSKVGRFKDALTLFKTIPMQNASSGDYQGAIGAALACTDMAQAETWLRQALGLYPNDPQILGLAARFEQARGNNHRATDFWRAALAAMPPGSAVKSLETGLVYPPEAYHAPAAGRPEASSRSTQRPARARHQGTASAFLSPHLIPRLPRFHHRVSGSILPLPIRFRCLRPLYTHPERNPARPQRRPPLPFMSRRVGC